MSQSNVRRFSGKDPPWDRMLALVPLGLGAVVVLYLALNSFYTVAPNEQAVVLRFGKFHGTTLPGLHFRVPLMDKVLKVSVEEHGLRLPYASGPDRPANASEEATLMLTGDLNSAAVEWTVQWQVTTPEEYLFRFYDPDDECYPERVIVTAAESVMDRLVGDHSFDEVLTEKREEVGEMARAGTQEILDQYQCGITIRGLQMQRVSPPEQVRPAFDLVTTSLQDRERFRSEAEKERKQKIPAAQAKRDQAIREAEGYADKQRAEAEGKIAALLAKYRAYQKAPEVTRQRLYLEEMQKVLQKVPSKTIIDAELNHLLPLLPLGPGGVK